VNLRTFRSARAVLVVGLGLALTGPTLATPALAGPKHRCVVEITQFEFRPPVVTEGQLAKLRLRAVNCTDRPQDVRLTRYGTESGSCPVLDPIQWDVTFRPFEIQVSREMFPAPPCAGTLSLTATFTDASGRLLSSRTAQLLIQAPTARAVRTSSPSTG
jgi:hypothetical protein